MKRYKDYMDKMEAFPQLQERLKELTAPAKPALWKRYGAAAAALVLVVGLGAAGISCLPKRTDITPAPSGAVSQPSGDEYGVPSGDAVNYFMLPHLHYVEEGASAVGDYSLAALGDLSREATPEDVALLAGGLDNMVQHLDWNGGLSWDGTLWFRTDGTPRAASLYAEGADVAFSVEMLEGGPVPDCIVLPEDSYETTEFAGVEIRALKNGGYRVENGVEMRESRKVSFMADGIGYKLVIYGLDSQRVELLAARFARWAIVEGFALSELDSAGAEPIQS